MRPIHGNPGLCRGQTAYSGNGEPGYPKWPGAVAILVPLAKGERLVRYEVNAVMILLLKAACLWSCIFASVCSHSLCIKLPWPTLLTIRYLVYIFLLPHSDVGSPSRLCIPQIHWAMAACIAILCPPFSALRLGETPDFSRWAIDTSQTKSHRFVALQSASCVCFSEKCPWNPLEMWLQVSLIINLYHRYP